MYPQCVHHEPRVNPSLAQPLVIEISSSSATLTVGVAVSALERKKEEVTAAPCQVVEAVEGEISLYARVTLPAIIQHWGF